MCSSRPCTADHSFSARRAVCVSFSTVNPLKSDKQRVVGVLKFLFQNLDFVILLFSIHFASPLKTAVYAPCNFNPHARTHRRANICAFDVFCPLRSTVFSLLLKRHQTIVLCVFDQFSDDRRKPCPRVRESRLSYQTRNSNLTGPWFPEWLLQFSKVTVPVLGLGIRPRGTKYFSKLTDPHASYQGVAITGVKVQPAAFDLVNPVRRHRQCRLSSGFSFFSCFSPAGYITQILFDFPRPCGRTTVPRTIWSALCGDQPRVPSFTFRLFSSNLAISHFLDKPHPPRRANISLFESIWASSGPHIFFPAICFLQVLT